MNFFKQTRLKSPLPPFLKGGDNERIFLKGETWGKLGKVSWGMSLAILLVSLSCPAFSQLPGPETPPLKRGNFYFNLGWYDDALKAYEEATKQNPGDASAWTHLGYAHYVLHNREKAVELLEKAVELSPLDGSVFALLLEVMEEMYGENSLSVWTKQEVKKVESLWKHLVKPHYEKSIEIYHQVMVNDPYDSIACYLLTKSYAALDDIPKFFTEINRCIAIAPQNPFLYLARAKVLAKSDKNIMANEAFNEILRDVKMALSLDRTLGKAYELDAMVLRKQGYYERALPVIENLFLYYHPLVAFTEWSYIMRLKYAKGAWFFSEEAQAVPYLLTVKQKMASLKTALEKTNEKASEPFWVLYKFSEPIASLLIYSGDMPHKHKFLKVFLDELHKDLSQDPKNWLTHFLLSMVYLCLDEQANAEKYAKKASEIKKDKDVLAIYYYWVSGYARLVGTLDVRLSALLKLKKLYKLWDVDYEIGAVYYQKGMKKEAKQYLSKVYQQQTYNRTYYESLPMFQELGIVPKKDDAATVLAGLGQDIPLGTCESSPMILKEAGYICHPIYAKKPLDLKNLSQLQLVVLDYRLLLTLMAESKEKISALERYVKEGGKLLVLAQTGGSAYWVFLKDWVFRFNPVLTLFGIRLFSPEPAESMLVLESLGFEPGMKQKIKFTEHPVFNNIKDFEVSGFVHVQANDASVLATAEGMGFPVIVEKSHGKGKIIVVGIHLDMYASARGKRLPPDTQLFLNLVGYLTQGEEYFTEANRQ